MPRKPRIVPTKPASISEYDAKVKETVGMIPTMGKPALGAFLRDRTAQSDSQSEVQQEPATDPAKNNAQFLAVWAALIKEYSPREFERGIAMSFQRTSIIDSTSRTPDSALPEYTEDKLHRMNDAEREVVVGAFKGLLPRMNAIGWKFPAGWDEFNRLANAYYKPGTPLEKQKAVAVEADRIVNGEKPEQTS